MRGRPVDPHDLVDTTRTTHPRGRSAHHLPYREAATALGWRALWVGSAMLAFLGALGATTAAGRESRGGRPLCALPSRCTGTWRPARLPCPATRRASSSAPFFPIPRASVRADPSAVEHTRITDRSVLYNTKASIYSPYYRSTFVARPYVPLAHRPPGTSLWVAPVNTPITELLAVATDPDGEAFPYAHSEQWLAASLADLFGDTLIAKRVRSPYVTPTHARRLTRSVDGFIRSVWEAERAEVALVGSLAKFAADPALAAALVATASGPAGPRVLVGASPRDREWGVGLSMDDPGVETPELWRGNNMLGVVLARVRDVLMAQPGR